MALYVRRPMRDEVRIGRGLLSDPILSHDVGFLDSMDIQPPFFDGMV